MASRAEASAPGGARPPAPFVVGVGRSGTTLLRMMLDAHPALAIPPETIFVEAGKAFERTGAIAAAGEMVRDELWPDYNLPAGEFIRRVERRRPAGFGDVLRTFFEFYAETRGKPRWGNKSPFHVVIMPEVCEVLPEARFVHIVRDGRDVALSTIPLWFGPDTPAEAARSWSGMLESARAQAARLPFYTEVRYEDLVTDPVPTLRRLCEFLELEWDPAMLDYHRDAAARIASESPPVFHEGRSVSSEERAGIHALLAAPPRRDRIGGWRREMSDADLRDFERIAGDTLERFGYERAADGSRRPGPAPERAQGQGSRA